MAAANALQLPTCKPANEESSEPFFTTMSGGLCVDVGCKFRHKDAFSKPLYEAQLNLYRLNPKFFRGINPKNAVHFAAWDRLYNEKPELDLPQEQAERIKFIGETVAAHTEYRKVDPKNAATD
eukprot:4929603-Amphidinium_carterae.1